MIRKPHLSLLFLVLFAACSITHRTVQLQQDAYKAFQNEDYATALSLYEEFIAHYDQDVASIPDTVYREAGLAAFELGHTEKTLQYLNRIRHSEAANAQTQYALAISNRKIDNLSREITALEAYVQHYPRGRHVREMQNRLFETYVESQNHELALELWPEIQQKARKEESLLHDYLKLLLAMDHDQKAIQVARELLELNAENTDALYHMAVHYFWQAENRYQEEMQAYEQNRTHRQYAQLLRAFEVLNEDFRTSLNYFLKLYDLDRRESMPVLLGIFT